MEFDELITEKETLEESLSNWPVESPEHARIVDQLASIEKILESRDRRELELKKLDQQMEIEKSKLAVESEGNQLKAKSEKRNTLAKVGCSALAIAGMVGTTFMTLYAQEVDGRLITSKAFKMPNFDKFIDKP